MNLVLSTFCISVCGITRSQCFQQSMPFIKKKTKKTEKLEGIHLQGCVTVPITALTSETKEGNWT